jgi:hypothetical protein
MQSVALTLLLLAAGQGWSWSWGRAWRLLQATAAGHACFNAA